MKKYSVLWFDDEFKELNLIKESATLNDISLYGFDNAKDGIEELEKNVLRYDAVIVDGKFYNKPGQSGDAVDDSALLSVARAIDRLSDKRVMPWFILSGQPSFTKEKNRYADGYKNNKVYDKIKPEQLQLLWNDLKKEADLQPETQIKHDYAKVFELCQPKYVGEAALKPLMQILKSIKEPHASFDDELYFTQIRIILELMFRAANKIGLLHDKCIDVNGKVNLSESSLFLSGTHTKHLNVNCKRSHFTKMISESVKSILFITGAASHTVEPELKNNINLTEYRASVNTPYLLYSLTFQLIDVLIWFKKYVDENHDIEKNKMLWLSQEKSVGLLQEGKVVNINPKGFAFFMPNSGGTNTFIPSHLVTLHKLSNENPVKVEIEEYVDAKNGETKRRVKQIFEIS